MGSLAGLSPHSWVRVKPCPVSDSWQWPCGRARVPVGWGVSFAALFGPLRARALGSLPTEWLITTILSDTLVPQELSISPGPNPRHRGLPVSAAGAPQVPQFCV